MAEKLPRSAALPVTFTAITQTFITKVISLLQMSHSHLKKHNKDEEEHLIRKESFSSLKPTWGAAETIQTFVPDRTRVSAFSYFPTLYTEPQLEL